MIEKLKNWLRCGSKSEERLVDYSSASFLEWHREREKHLQMIDHLKARIAELSAEKEMWQREAMRDIVR